MMRIALFLGTNMAVMLIASVVLRLLGIDQMVGGGMTASLIYCALFGMGENTFYRYGASRTYGFRLGKQQGWYDSDQRKP